MNIFLKICFMLIFTLIVSVSFASANDIKISADEVQYSTEKNTMTFSGNVVCIIDSGNVVFKNEKNGKIMVAAKQVKFDSNKNEFTYEGDVKIINENIEIKTEKATVLKEDQRITIKMQSAEITQL